MKGVCVLDMCMFPMCVVVRKPMLIVEGVGYRYGVALRKSNGAGVAPRKDVV
jgi:hypothetical protein